MSQLQIISKSATNGGFRRNIFSFKDVESLVPFSQESPIQSSPSTSPIQSSPSTSQIQSSPSMLKQESIVQSWPSVKTPRAVVYMTVTMANSEACRNIRSILSGFCLTLEERYVLMNSNFTSMLERNLMVNSVSLPRVFIGGRYVGGLNELRELVQTGKLDDIMFRLPEVEDGVCPLCGGYKFILFDSTDLITCSTCNGTGLESDIGFIDYDSSLFSDYENKLFICLEAVDYEQRNVYMICSIEGSYLATQQTHSPSIIIEAVIYGYPSMGCGVYGSNIILAGGVLPSHPDRHNDCITFDMTDNSVSYEPPFLLMNEGKYKPLVFELNNRLYVCDSEYHFDDTLCSNRVSIECFTPFLKTKWLNVFSVFEGPDLNGPLANYSCLVFGNSCLMSVPYEDATYITHSNYLDCDWEKYSDKSLPFTGVATFHSQDGFEDFVMIYFEKGVVRVCRIDFSCFGKSQDLFSVESRTEGGDMHGYFANFGKGCFCLTAFDKSYVYLYTFAITRDGTQSEPLKVTHRILSWYTFGIDRLCTEGRLVSSIAGCFAQSRDKEAKSRAEKVAATYFNKYPKVNDDYDPWEKVIWKE